MTQSFQFHPGYLYWRLGLAEERYNGLGRMTPYNMNLCVLARTIPFSLCYECLCTDNIERSETEYFSWVKCFVSSEDFCRERNDGVYWVADKQHNCCRTDPCMLFGNFTNNGGATLEQIVARGETGNDWRISGTTNVGQNRKKPASRTDREYYYVSVFQCLLKTIIA